MEIANVILITSRGQTAIALKELMAEKFHLKSFFFRQNQTDSLIDFKKLAQTAVDAIILNLSQISGNIEQTISHLNDSFPETPLIVLHHYDQKIFAEAFIKMGAKAYLPINFHQEELLQAIGLALSNEVYLSNRLF